MSLCVCVCVCGNMQKYWLHDFFQKIIFIIATKTWVEYRNLACIMYLEK